MKENINGEKCDQQPHLPQKPEHAGEPSVASFCSLQKLCDQHGGKKNAPLMCSHISAGAPTEATDEIEELVNYPNLFSEIKEPYILEVEGNSMVGANIDDGDYLLVDAAASAQDQDIIVAMINGQMTVKRLSQKNGWIKLVPENPTYEAWEITRSDDFKIVGVVKRIIKEAT